MRSKSALLLGALAGGLRVRKLQESCDAVPDAPGVYVIVRRSVLKPKFKKVSSGGHFNGKDPTVAVAELRRKWVPRADIVYIGKAGGPGQRPTLQSRLWQYMRFGLGQRSPHRGGRYLWQLADAKNLRVFWKEVHGEDPADVERALLCEFVACYGVLPFVNLRK